MKEKTKPKYNTLQNVGWMIGMAWKGCRSVIGLCLLSVILSVALNLAELFVAPEILDKVEQSAPLSELVLTIGGFTALLFLLQGAKRYVEENTLFGRIKVRIDILLKRIEKDCTTSYPHVLDPEMRKWRQRANRSLKDNRSAGEYIWETLKDVLMNAAGFVIYLCILSYQNLSLMLLVLLTSLVSFFAVRKTNEWRQRREEEEAVYLDRMSYIRGKAESIALAKDIRIFGLSQWLTEVYSGTLRLYEDFDRRKHRVVLISDAVEVVMSVLRNGVAYIYLVQLALNTGLSAAQFLLYFSAVTGFAAWITGILNGFATLHQESGELSVTREYLEMEEPFRMEGGEEIPAAEGYELRLEQVSFRYPGAEQDTIHKLDLTIHAGEKVAVVGLNGAGKTTLVKLLCGLLDPTEGCVLLNGKDIRAFDRRAYYRMFSAVFQTCSALELTVKETVAQQVDGIDLKRVEECLEKAGLTEKIHAFPNGLDTHVGRTVYEDGVLLSGGQMQRLMLARALYKNGPILLLDEPTAALDPIAESDIYLKYNEMTEGKTSLFISHRLASTRFCDRILFVADGGIAEEGTHEQLLELGGRYAELFEVQSRYYQEGREF